ESGVIGDRILGLERLLAGEDLLRFCLHAILLVPSGTYRRQAVAAIGGYRPGLWQSEDFDFHVRLANSGPRFEVVIDPLIRIRLRDAGRSRANPAEVWQSAVQMVEHLSLELPKRYRIDLAEAAARFGS